jgi:hypothetical protein
MVRKELLELHAKYQTEARSSDARGYLFPVLASLGSNFLADVEGQDEKLLQLPIRLLRGVDFQLLRNAVERPVLIRIWQIDAATIDIRFTVRESVCLGPDDAAIDDALVEVGARREDAAFAQSAFLDEGEHRDLVALERHFQAVSQSNTIGVFMIGRRLDDDADHAARMQNEAIGAGDVNQGDNLGAEGEDEIRMMVDAVRHLFSTGAVADILVDRQVDQALLARNRSHSCGASLVERAHCVPWSASK